ncbi:MAG: hexitol phosphatase HxpB [Bacteroidota bacterium]
MNKIDLSEFDAIIFDMDGVLVDSEPLWKISMEEVFHSMGSKLTKTDFQKTVGMRIDQVISYWKRIEGWNEQVPEIQSQIINRMIELINENGKPLPGVEDTIEYLSKLKILGLASSSPNRLIESVLIKTQLKSHFRGVFSAETEVYGKPHPAVYLTAAAKLGVEPQRCLVVEDSLNGIISGKAANMTVVCIPEITHLRNPKLILADNHFDSMTKFLEAIA